MLIENSQPLSAYKDISPLCERGHVMLVQGEFDGQFYVKKTVQCYNAEFYIRLMKGPIKNTPKLYGIYENNTEETELVRNLIIIEEYIPGENLAEHLTTAGPFTEEETIDIIMQLCRILMDLHEMNPPVIHRDIKPSNIMLLPDGSVKLLDFDAAKDEISGQKRDTVLLGTAGFAAPEQYGFSASSPRTDIYSVGVLTNIMLTGKLPSVQIADGRLKKIVRKCLEFNPKDRFKSVRELYHELKQLKKYQVPWLLPGFRSLHWPKMILAFMGYSFYVLFIMRADTGGFETPNEILFFRIYMLLFGLSLVCFFGNYMNIHKWFPFMKSRRWWLKLIGYVISPILIYWIEMVILVTIQIIVS